MDVLDAGRGFTAADSVSRSAVALATATARDDPDRMAKVTSARADITMALY
jgi:hypothetical protein